MIEQVILDIRQAEEEAKLIAEKSIADAKSIVATAEIEAGKERKNTVSRCKDEFRMQIAQSEKEANLAREAIIEEGKLAADKLLEDKKLESQKVADFIVETFVKKF